MGPVCGGGTIDAQTVSVGPEAANWLSVGATSLGPGGPVWFSGAEESRKMTGRKAGSGLPQLPRYQWLFRQIHQAPLLQNPALWQTGDCWEGCGFTATRPLEKSR
jgi:hypothetical protein